MSDRIVLSPRPGPFSTDSNFSAKTFNSMQTRKEGSSKVCSLGFFPRQAQEKELMTNTGRFTRRGAGLLALAISAVLATLAPSAQADTIVFDPTGTPGAAGDIPGVVDLGFSSASVLAQGIGSGIPTAPVSYNVYYQSVFLAVSNANGPVFGTGGNPFATSNNTFTAVAGFRETATPQPLVPNATTATLNFTLASPPGFSTSTTTPNFFQIYQKPAVAGVPNNATGAGYATGNVILQGFIVPTAGATSIGNFAVNGLVNGTGTAFTPTIQQFTSNPNGVNPTPTSNTSITGQGSTALSVVVTFADPLFFPVAPAFLNFSTTNTLPFSSQTPNGSFFNGTGVPLVPNLDVVNGNGPDLEFSSAAHAQVVVPEPSAILQAFTAAGLLSSLAFLKRRQTKPTVA
jgi:hypothetical protein